ncbi:hypothetical protein N7474_006100 [Penicillium riverlandense]|uniref:uncharacterized protein n=1 Tax=Penicillium riverlandense TaxID=1903569 RepID=UPI002548CB1D|nr:uncharacterized protein N7474_006100 [Penicillium riverlandense]KAJ5820509.1 hypothetical protein N7474_006100 [Penicillium riverlandense]
MGSKRARDGKLLHHPAPPSPATAMNSTRSTALPIFETFRDELDEHHDRRERIIKTSRDITALSKKMYALPLVSNCPALTKAAPSIFALQRIRTVKQPLPPKIDQENESRYEQIRALFASVVLDLAGIKAWRYQRQISSGLQEFVEAIAFEHYLRTQTLLTHDEAAAQIPTGISLSEEDYLMGLFDMTGEVMRFAVLALSSGNASQVTELTGADGDSNRAATKTPRLAQSHADLVIDLRAMRAQFESLSMPHRHNMLRDFVKKVEVMQTSVEKVERAAYGVLVRGSERPSGWTPDLSGPVEVEIH